MSRQDEPICNIGQYNTGYDGINFLESTICTHELKVTFGQYLGIGRICNHQFGSPTTVLKDLKHPIFGLFCVFSQKQCELLQNPNVANKSWKVINIGWSLFYLCCKMVFILYGKMSKVTYFRRPLFCFNLVLRIYSIKIFTNFLWGHTNIL